MTFEDDQQVSFAQVLCAHVLLIIHFSYLLVQTQSALTVEGPRPFWVQKHHWF